MTATTKKRPHTPPPRTRRAMYVNNAPVTGVQRLAVLAAVRRKTLAEFIFDSLLPLYEEVREEAARLRREDDPRVVTLSALDLLVAHDLEPVDV